MRIFSAPGTIEGINTLKDRGTKVVFVTHELNPDDMASLFSFHQKEGVMAFKEEDFADKEIIKLDNSSSYASIPNKKTPSQRLRAAFYRLWEQQGKPSGDFEPYYQRRMEAIIQQVLDKLD